MNNSTLFKKVYGCLMGSAIGDAMGGPVEMLDYTEIKRDYGIVDDLLYYKDVEPNAFGPWKQDAGTVTDDTRLRNIFIDAIVSKSGEVSEHDIYRVILKNHYSAKSDLAKEWINEYAYKAVYRDNKLAFGGQPTNATVMSSHPFGLLHLCDPVKSFSETFNCLKLADGYSRYSGALVASMISASLIKDIKNTDIITSSINAMNIYKARTEGSLWQKNSLYQHVGMENEKIIDRAIEIGNQYKDSLSIEFQEAANSELIQKYKYDGSETIALSIAVMVAENFKFKESVIGAVNLGRDNDSSATVVGGICGALHGIDSIPTNWIETINKANPEFNIEDQAEQLTKIISNSISNDSVILNHKKSLI